MNGVILVSNIAYIDSVSEIACQLLGIFALAKLLMLSIMK